MSTRAESAELRRRVLRCVPLFGSGESVGPIEVFQRLELSMTPDHAAVYFKRLRDRGLVVRLRPGAYQLAPTSTTQHQPREG